MKMFDVEGGVCKMATAMEKAVNVVRVHGGFCVNKSVLIRIEIH